MFFKWDLKIEEIDSFQSEVNLICAGHDVGYFSKEQVIQWADYWIERLEVPPIELIEISMDQEDLIALSSCWIKSLGSQQVPVLMIELGFGFIGLLINERELSVPASLRKLWDLSDWPDEADHLRHEVVKLDVQYELIQDGYGKIEELKIEMQQFLAPYVDSVSKQLKQLPACLQSNSL